MNLSKLWNSKYLFENIKKSRMTIILFFIIVPIFTSLMIITTSNETLEYDTIASINIMGMYIIPFIFSVSLFEFVFKKNSADFIGSMPISRRCIFITNTIGGILLIVLMQAITLLLALIVSLLSNGVLFFGMAWDIFIYQTISYIFVFTIANLAMTFSGTPVAQIALTILIAFVIPFLTWYINIMTNGMSGEVSYKLINDGTELMSINKTQNCTAPFLFFIENEYKYNVISMIKMIFLSIIYFVIGLYLFKNKKMETANESFENKYIHFIIKGLTLIPFIAILKSLSVYEEEILTVIVFAIVVVYYFVFDLITCKKIKVVENIFALIISIAMLYGAFSIAICINEKIDKKISLDSIKVASFKINNQFYTKVTDKNIINSTIVSLVKASNRYDYDDYENHRSYSVYIELADNFGNKYHDYLYISNKALPEIFDESFKNVQFSNNVIISNNNLDIAKAEREEIFTELDNVLKTMSAKQIVEFDVGINDLTVDLKEYINHELVEISYPVILNKRIEKIMISAYNRNAIKYLENGLHDIYYMIDSYDKLDDETIEKIWFVTGSSRNEKLISDFILANKNNIPDDLTKCIKISSGNFSFFTDNIEDFLELINKYCEEHKEEFNYMGGK